MGIYNNSSFNPLGAIQAAISNANAAAQIRGNEIRRQGDIWSKFASDMGSMGGRLLDAYQAQQESPEARLQALEAELQEAERAEALKQAILQRRAERDYVDNYDKRVAAAKMEGYVPNDYVYVTDDNVYSYPEGLFNMQEFYRRGR